MTLSRDDYVRRITESGVLDAAEVEAFLARVPVDKVPDAQTLARELVRAGKLTKYQAAAIYQGKTKGLVIGKYVVLDKIGAGGMGQVFKAVHKRMDRVVALKVLPPEATKSLEAVKRFHREVKAAARLEHPNIVTAHDADEAAGIHFLVMQFADGQDLASLVRDHGPLPIPLAVECMRQAAVGLAYAHRQGVVHRDIKPGNLLLGKDGTVKVLDMGLARLEEQIAEETAARGLTQSGQIMGTVDYMSPEQAEETRSVDGRTDIYSLGCTLYVLLTGRPMYGGTTTIQKLMAHRTAPIPKLRLARADAPATLDDVYHKMVAKEPSDRYATMDEVVEALASCLATPATVEVGKPSSSDSQLTEFFQRVSAEKKSPPVSLTSADVETINREPRKEETGTAHAVRAESMPPLAKPAAKKLVSNILPVPGANVAAAPRAAGKRKSKLPLAIIGGAVGGVIGLTLLVPLLFWNFAGGPASSDNVGVDSTTPSARNAVATPKKNYALEFTGMSYVDLPEAVASSDGTGTVELWVAPKTRKRETFVHLAGKQRSISISKFDGFYRALFEHNGRYQDITSAAVASTGNTFDHLAVTLKNDHIKMFVNGKEVTKWGNWVAIPDWNSRHVYQSSLGRYRHQNPTGKTESPPFEGQHDEVRISNVVRYPNNFTPERKFQPDANTLALYHCDEGAGEVLRDASGNHHHGKIVGAKWVPVEQQAQAARLPDYAPLATGKWQAVVWSDDDLNAWRTKAPEGCSVKVEHGVVDVISTPAYSLPIPRRTPRNFIIRAQVRRLNNRRQHSVLGIRSGEDSLAACIHAAFGIGEKVGDNAWVDHDYFGAPAECQQDWFEWTLALIDDHATVYLNGVKRLDVKSRYPQRPSQIVLGSEGRSQFRNVELMVLDESSGPVELLPLINLSRDALDAGVTKEKGVLLTPVWGNKNTRVTIPYGPIPEEYDLRLVAERKGDDRFGLNLGFVMGGRQGVLDMDGGSDPVWCISRIDGKSMHDGNITVTKGKRFEIGQLHTVVVQVRRAGIRVLFDGEKLIQWLGKPEQLSLWDKIMLPSKDSLFLFSQAEFAIHELTLTPVVAPPANSR